MTSKNAPKIRPRASKKNKKSWRKNTDLVEVEDFLEDQRLEERLGGAFQARPDEALFVVDKGPAGEASQEVEQPRKTRKQLRAEKPLRCFTHLETQGQIPDPVGLRTRVKSDRERQNPMLAQQLQTQRQQGWRKAKEVAGEAHRVEAVTAKKREASDRKTRRRMNFDFDLWTGDLPKEQQAEVIRDNEWLNETTKRHNLKENGKWTFKTPADLHHKSSSITAVVQPHAGESYNPSYAEHQDLMWKAALVELKKEKEIHKIEYHTTRMFPKASEAPTQASWLKEMSEGIRELAEAQKDEDASESEDEDASDEDEDLKKGNKAKTRKQRRKAIMVSAQDKKLLRLREEKRKNQDIFKVKKLKRTLVAQEKLTQTKMRKRRMEKEAKMDQPAVLSAHKFEEPDLDLKLSDELPGNLRTLKPEGNLLFDRYNSLKRRNLVETRVKHKVVKNGKKRKKVEKRNYKMPWQAKH
eukprot:maker-scaffold299_size217019-snap-gene-1.26 protein:Tk09193 transcript:maker-scaffold299_size217019-snap-gene-1.26-mRNA-1 annotation:"CG1785"